MRAQENSPVTSTTHNKNNSTTISSNNSNNSSVCTSTCPNKGKIQTLRQRKSELEKLLDEKNLLLQQIQRQEAQIIGSEYLSSSFAFNNTTADSNNGFHNITQQQQQQHLNQQSTSITLRRKVGSSFKLPRINKKEHQLEIENLLLEKKLQQEISNASYKLANDLTLTKSVRRTQKAEYEAAQQKLSIINQNLNVLKKRQLRSHSTSFSDNYPTYNTNNVSTIIGEGNTGTSIMNLKPPPPPPPPMPSPQVLIRNVGNNYSLKSNNTSDSDSSQLMPPKKDNNSTATINNYPITSKSSNVSNRSNSSNNICRSSNSNNLLSDRRNSIKSAILSSSKHTNSSSSPSSALIQHFDRTLKNHRSDYDINHTVPSHHLIDKYHYIDGLTISDANYLNNNYCNTFPLQQFNNQRIYHDNVNTDQFIQQKQHQQQIVIKSNDISSNCDTYAHDNQFEMISNCNRTSGNFETSVSPLSHPKDERFNVKHLQCTALYNTNENLNVDFSYSPNNANINANNNEYTMVANSPISGDWKHQNKRYEVFDTMPVYPSSPPNQQKRAGLGGFWQTLPNNERIWHSTANVNFDGRKTLQNKTQQIPTFYPLDEITLQTTKDEISDKISISSTNSEINKKSREKQWLETSLDTPVMIPKYSTSIDNDEEQLINAQFLPYHHHHDNNMFSHTSTLPISSGHCNLNSISNSICPAKCKILYNNYKDRPKLSSQSMSNKRPLNQQRLEDQSRLSHSTSVLNQQYFDSNHHIQQQQGQQKQSENQSENENLSSIMNPPRENNTLYVHNNDTQEASQQPQQQLLQSSSHQFLHQYPMPLLVNRGINKVSSNFNDTLTEIPFHCNSFSPSFVSSTTGIENQNNNSNNNFYKNFGAVLMTNMSKAQEIRVESPKNMTVIQKAVFVPYKEVTKPFEMSDFYKYSTKFRQKDQQQQQQSNNNNGAGTSSTIQIKQQQQLIGNTKNSNCDATRSTTVEEVK